MTTTGKDALRAAEQPKGRYRVIATKEAPPWDVEDLRPDPGGYMFAARCWTEAGAARIAALLNADDARQACKHEWRATRVTEARHYGDHLWDICPKCGATRRAT